MVIITNTGDLETVLHNRSDTGTLGFIPTMGALHLGHISLVKAAKSKNSLVITSIFVNPTQFNDPQDFEKYPKTLEKDVEILENAGCDFLFIPKTEEMYPRGILNDRFYDLGQIENKLEGLYRPGHFQGVCNIVDKLFQLIDPDEVYFGQKDYQQCLIIKKMIDLQGHRCLMNICPTVRENDGLAMSSRNMRLNPEQRSKASTLYKVMCETKESMKAGMLSELKEVMKSKLNQHGFQTEYFEISDPETLESIEFWDGKKPLVILTAVYLNDIRLIDNLMVL